MAAIDPIGYPNCCDCCLLFPLNHQLHLAEAHKLILLQHLVANHVLLAQTALATHLRPYDFDKNTTRMDGLAKQQGRRRHSKHRRKDGGGLLPGRCARRSPVDSNKRGGRVRKKLV